ncbi:hypothetical protein [Acetoanaerobium sticklandii]|uniref:hypothetical protein n=1 Tax=Acetoanaerobium sticklandii TaxID=1511 RepID=UPI003A8D7963
MRVSELRKNIRKHKVITYPGQNFEVAIVRLDARELIEANVKLTERLGKENVMNPDIVNLMYQLEQLSIALRSPLELSSRIISREELESEELSVISSLFEEWTQIQTEASDTIDEISTENFEELKKKLKKIHLKDLDGELRKILNYLQMTLVSREDMNN